MAATRTTLKQYFKKYATPTEEQFAALIDAFVHKDEDSLTQSKIDGLTAALESKVSSSDLASAVATAVAETLQGGNIEVTPAAHQHAIADVEDLQAFVTKVNNFLESADVSDETINRWVEIETFLTGITDQETLAGLLLQLKNEILAQIPEPQTGNYLKQISDLDAYTDAQEGEIVQYVGTSTADYTRGFCYERVEELLTIPKNTQFISFDIAKLATEPTNIVEEIPGLSIFYVISSINCYSGSGIKCVGDVVVGNSIVRMVNTSPRPSYEILSVEESEDNFICNCDDGNSYVLSKTPQSIQASSNMALYLVLPGTYNGQFYGSLYNPQTKKTFNLPHIPSDRYSSGSTTQDSTIRSGRSTWQPIATSPVVS